MADETWVWADGTIYDPTIPGYRMATPDEIRRNTPGIEAKAEVERLRAALSRIADRAKYLSEPAWTPEGCALVGKQIYRWATDALDPAAGKGRP